MSTEKINQPRRDSTNSNDSKAITYHNANYSQNQFESFDTLAKIFEEKHCCLTLKESQGKFIQKLTEPPSYSNVETNLPWVNETVLKIIEPKKSASTSPNPLDSNLSEKLLRKKSPIRPKSSLRKYCKSCCSKSTHPASSSSTYVSTKKTSSKKLVKKVIDQKSPVEIKTRINFYLFDNKNIMLGGNRYSSARARRRYSKHRSLDSFPRPQKQNLPKTVKSEKVSSTNTIDIDSIQKEIQSKLFNFHIDNSQTLENVKEVQNISSNTNAKIIMDETAKMPSKITEESKPTANNEISNTNNETANSETANLFHHTTFNDSQILPTNTIVKEDSDLMLIFDNKTFNKKPKSEGKLSSSTTDSNSNMRLHILSSHSSSNSSLLLQSSSSMESEQIPYERQHPTVFISISPFKKTKNYSSENIKRSQHELNHINISCQQMSNQRNYTNARNIRSIENISQAKDDRIHRAVSMSKIEEFIKYFNTNLVDQQYCEINHDLLDKGCQTIGEQCNKQELKEISIKNMKFPSMDDAMQRTWEWVNNIENNIKADDTSESILLLKSNHELTLDDNYNSASPINENNTSQVESVESVPKLNDSFETLKLNLYQIFYPDSILSVQGSPLFLAQPLKENSFVTDALKNLNSPDHITELVQKKNKIRDNQPHVKNSSSKNSQINRKYCSLSKIKIALHNLFSIRKKNV